MNKAGSEMEARFIRGWKERSVGSGDGGEAQHWEDEGERQDGDVLSNA